MNENQNVEYNSGDPEGIWKVGSGFGLFEKVNHSIEPKNPVEPNYDRAGHHFRAFARPKQVGQVGRQNAEHIKNDIFGLPIVFPQFQRILDQQTLLKIPWKKWRLSNS